MAIFTMISLLVSLISMYGLIFIESESACVQAPKDCTNPSRQGHGRGFCEELACWWDTFPTPAQCKVPVPAPVSADIPVAACNCAIRTEAKTCREMCTFQGHNYRGCLWEKEAAADWVMQERNTLETTAAGNDPNGVHVVGNPSNRVRWATMEKLTRNPLNAAQPTLSYVHLEGAVGNVGELGLNLGGFGGLPPNDAYLDNYQLPFEIESKDKMVVNLNPFDKRRKLGRVAAANPPWYDHVAKNGLKRIGLISFKDFNGGEYRCTGTLINSEYVITAAHCIVEAEDEFEEDMIKTGGPPATYRGAVFNDLDSFRFYPGISTRTALDPQDGYRAEAYYVPRGYIKNSDWSPAGSNLANDHCNTAFYKYDFALVKIRDRVRNAGLPEHWFGIGYCEDEFLNNDNIMYSAGYPSDRKNTATNKHYMYIGAHAMTSIHPRYITDSKHKTYFGQSGSAVWRKYGPNIIYGILSCGNTGWKGFASDFDIGTKFVRINKSKFHIIKAIIENGK